jgi:GH18 family chitinase
MLRMTVVLVGVFGRRDIGQSQTVRHKVAWAKRMGLGGVYVWNLQDDS